MPVVGLALLALAGTPAVPPNDKIGLSGPRFVRGDELIYSGEVVETAERIGTRFVKKYLLDVRVFVLESDAEAAVCAVMTSLTPQPDEHVVSAVVAVSGGGSPAEAAPSVRLDFVRVDSRGRVRVLAPSAKLPLSLGERTATTEPPLIPTDKPADFELGVFLPMPLAAANVGDSWDVAEANRPPVVWEAKQSAVWNGRQVADVTGQQQSDGYDTPKTVRFGWLRTERVYVSPTDGLVSAFTRVVLRREGIERVGSITTKLVLQPSTRQVGVKYRETRAEVEAAWVFAAELDQLRELRAKPEVIDAHRREVVRFTELRPTGTGFRPAIEAVLRRFEVNAAPPVVLRAAPPSEIAAVAIGKPAPDFTCADVDKLTSRVRLSAVRGKPAVVVFFTPGTVTSEETLTVCEALYRRYGEEVKVVPLALGGDLLAASKQKADLKYTVPIFDGEGVREKYEVRSYPLFFLVDAEGTMRWHFDAGIGPEVGSLLTKEIEKVSK